MTDRNVTAIAIPEPVDQVAVMTRIRRGVGHANAVTVQRLALDGRPYVAFAFALPVDGTGFPALASWVRRVGGVLLAALPGQ